ncbi:hypothetical protein C8Q76DRAFT_83039 [Earliella scabrosa]|nr:hypothetical protein C8Q76DRAFT_83039 [Earliella scabrosa]
MPRTRSGNAGKRQAPPGKARGRSAQVKADNETKAKNAKAKEQEKTKDQQMAVVLMEQEQASVDEEVCITRVTRRTTRGAALLAQRREVEPAPAPVQAPKKRTRSEQKAEEAEEKRRLAREEMMEVHVDSDEDARFQADESSLSELSAEEDEDPTPTPGGDVEEETETETEPEEEDAPKPQKKKRKVAESTTDVDIPEEQPTAQIRKRQANSEQSTGDVSRQPRPDPKPLKRPPRHEVTHDDSSMQDQEPIRAKPSKVKGRKKRDDPDFFEDYNVTEYVVVDGDNEYTESGSDDEEVLATQASLSRKGVQVSSASLVKVHTGLIVKKKAAPKSDMINTEDADVAPKKAISTSSVSRTQHEDAEAAPPLIVRKYVEATPKKKRVAPTLSEVASPSSPLQVASHPPSVL